MTWINSQISMADAIARSLDVWELFVSNWGNEAAPSADGTSLSFPPLLSAGLPSVAGIGIGPMSHVDRVMVAYDLQKLVPQSATWDYARRVTQNMPLLFLQPANQGQVTNVTVGEAGSSSLAIYNKLRFPLAANVDDGLRFDNSYVKADGTVATFGEQGAAADSPRFLAPLLHLYFYLRPPVVAPPTKRLPFIWRDNVRATAPAEQLCFQVPVCGRKTVIVGIKSVEAGNYRLGLIQTFNDANVPQEATVSSGALAANTRVRVPITPAFGDYLMVYVTVAAGGQTVVADVYATDD